MYEIKYLSISIKFKIPNAFSKKDKRSVIKSIKRKIRNEFNASITEIDHLENINLAVLGIIVVGNDYSFLDKIGQSIINKFDVNHRIEVLDVKRNFNKEAFYDL